MGQGCPESLLSMPHPSLPPTEGLQEVLGWPDPFHSRTTRDWESRGRRRQAAEGNLLWSHPSPSGPGRGGGAQGASAGLKQEARAKPGKVAGRTLCPAQGSGGVGAGHAVRFLTVRQERGRPGLNKKAGGKELSAPTREPEPRPLPPSSPPPDCPGQAWSSVKRTWVGAGSQCPSQGTAGERRVNAYRPLTTVLRALCLLSS